MTKRLSASIAIVSLLAGVLLAGGAQAQEPLLTSTVGVFELRGGTIDQHKAIGKKIVTADYPWAKLLPHIRKWGRNTLPVHIEDLSGSKVPFANGYADRIGSGIWIAERLSPWEAGQTFIAEAAHLVDAATFDRSDREDIMALVEPETEDWLTWNVPYGQQAGEAFMSYFDNAFSDGFYSLNWGGYYSMAPENIPTVRAITLAAADLDPFTDWASVSLKTEVERAAGLGLINGYTDGTFGPQDPLTREQAAALMVRMYDLIESTN